MMLKLISGLLILSSISTADPDRDKWIHGVDKFAKIAYPLKHEFATFVDTIANDASVAVSSDCRVALSKFSTGLMNNEYESMVLFDSFSKVRSGAIKFAGYNYGAYRQCLDHGRYVYMGIEFPTPLDPRIKQFKQISPNISDWRITWSKSIEIRRWDPYHFAICVPDSCTEEDVKGVLKSKHLQELIDPLSARVITTESRSDPFTINWTRGVAILTVMGILSLGFWAAALNYVFPDLRISQLLKPFDVVENLIKLFSPVKHEDSMAVVSNTYRSMYLLSGACAHTMISINVATLLQRLEAGNSLIVDIDRNFVSPVVSPMVNALPSLITVHMIATGSFTVVRWIPVMMKERVNLMTFAMDRIFRTLPVVAMYLVIIQTLPIISHGGPLMKHVQQGYADVCFRNGWKELLFINNYGEMREICLPVAWFISSEFQLYLMSFLILIAISRSTLR